MNKLLPLILILFAAPSLCFGESYLCIGEKAQNRVKHQGKIIEENGGNFGKSKINNLVILSYPLVAILGFYLLNKYMRFREGDYKEWLLYVRNINFYS